MPIDPDVPHMEDHFADLERDLIDEYIRSQGHDPDEIRKRDDPAAHKLRADAATHAAGRLTEVESRAHLKDDLHE